MNLIRLATSAVNQTPLNWTKNLTNLVGCIRESKARGASLVCLPELAITGYGCEDQFLSSHTSQKALVQLEKLLPEASGMVVAVGLPFLFQNAVYNVVAVIVDGELVGFYGKQNLAGDGIHYETRWFQPWPQDLVVEVNVFGKTLPLGDCVFDVGGVRIGFEVCEDAWVADRPGRRYAEYGVDLILNPSASHFAFGKQETRRQFVSEGSRAFGVAYVYANLMGNEAGRAIYDGGSLIASNGRIIAEGPRFSFQEQAITTAVVDLELNRLAQAKTMSRQVQPPGESLVHESFDWLQETISNQAVELRQWTKEVEFTRAVTLGLYDYMRKSHSNGFVVSLSGGADSAGVACLVYLMKWLVEQETSHSLPDLKELLICVYQASENSGEVIRRAAKTLAEALGADYDEWEIQQNIDLYVSNAEKTIGRKLTWEQDDLTLQNIQARVRAPGVWMLANIRNALLLATSNRSEAAVGYATMDGDTCGGLSPISGIDKAFLLHWLQWLETQGDEEIPTIPALAVINRQVPTAELRPMSEEQTDEDDLMPYPVLDLIERLAIRDKKPPLEVYRLLCGHFRDLSEEILKDYVIRFFTLWCRNQWKRERYAPSFHLDDENLDPKTWCRFPILSGGFAEELEALAKL